MSAIQLLMIVTTAAVAQAATSNNFAPDQFMQSPLQKEGKHSLVSLKAIPDDEKKEKKDDEPKHVYDGPPAEFTSETMPKVSPAVQCVINLSIQYFVVYTLLAFMRTFNQFTGNSLLGMQKILETACTTVTYAPMLAVLFLGIRMRAIQLTQGQTEKYGLPQYWVQQAMYVSTYAVLAQVILVVLMPMFTGEWEVKCDEEGNLDQSALKSAGICGIIVSAFRYLIMLALYGAMITVIVGAFLMEGPKEIWGE
jgi:hypothetical protein